MRYVRAMLSIVTRYSPQRRLAAVLATVALLWLLPDPIGIYAGSGALGAVLILLSADFLLLPTRAAVVVEREFPRNVGIGDTVTGAYTISNRGDIVRQFGEVVIEDYELRVLC